jgi:hypothetical protein
MANEKEPTAPVAGTAQSRVSEVMETARRVLPTTTANLAVVSLNELTLAIDKLTSQRLRDILKAQSGNLDQVANCGCDKADCGCFGSNCPCNKLHEGIEDIYSIDQFVRFREDRIAELRRQLEDLQVDEEDINRLRR